MYSIHYDIHIIYNTCILCRYVYDPVRNKVYHEKETPMSDADISKITPSHMPTTWAHMWNNVDAKKKVYRLLSDMMIERIKHQKGTCPDTQYIIHNMDGDILTYPAIPGGYESTMQPLFYGEGDLKAIMWTMHHARDGERTLLATIDWDLPITTMPYDACVDILISRV